MTERPLTADYRTPVDPESGALMTIEEYLADVEGGGLMDDDGIGAPVKDGLEAHVEADESGWPAWLRPSDGINKIPQDATHVIWFNK